LKSVWEKALERPEIVRNSSVPREAFLFPKGAQVPATMNQSAPGAEFLWVPEILSRFVSAGKVSSKLR
jgi:hypothetical protein